MSGDSSEDDFEEPVRSNVHARPFRKSTTDRSNQVVLDTATERRVYIRPLKELQKQSRVSQIEVRLHVHVCVCVCVRAYTCVCVCAYVILVSSYFSSGLYS